MFRRDIQGNLSKREFDELEKQKLGKYVYALRDPRDNKIFYVGQGENNRLFCHFAEAEDCLRNGKIGSSKVIRILDIWKNEEDVDWFIVAHCLENADTVESAVIDTLSQSQNGPVLNQVSGPKSSMLTQDDITALAAMPVNPSVPLSRVLIFPIQNGLALEKSPYEATRGTWRVKAKYRDLSEPTYAVGLRNGISIGSYKIEHWDISSDGKYEFTGIEDDILLSKSWNKVLSRAKGYWQRGNFLVVRFDGKGKAQIVRGAEDNQQWFTL